MAKRSWLALALIVHAVIHGLAFQSAWGISSREEFSGVPAFPVVGAGSPAARWLGVLWLVAAVGFVITAMLLVGGRSAWRPAAVTSAVVSLAVCILWWHDAPAGAAVDLLLLGGMAAGGLRSARAAHARRPRPAATQAVGGRAYGTMTRS